MTQKDNKKTEYLKKELMDLACMIETKMFSYDKFIRDAFWATKNLDRELTKANCAVPDDVYGNFNIEDLAIELSKLIGVIHHHRESISYVALCKEVVDLTRHFYEEPSREQYEEMMKQAGFEVINEYKNKTEEETILSRVSFEKRIE
jgi:hypothetical protein